MAEKKAMVIYAALYRIAGLDAIEQLHKDELTASTTRR